MTARRGRLGGRSRQTACGARRPRGRVWARLDGRPAGVALPPRGRAFGRRRGLPAPRCRRRHINFTARRSPAAVSLPAPSAPLFFPLPCRAGQPPAAAPAFCPQARKNAARAAFAAAGRVFFCPVRLCAQPPIRVNADGRLSAQAHRTKENAARGGKSRAGRVFARLRAKSGRRGRRLARPARQREKQRGAWRGQGHSRGGTSGCEIYVTAAAARRGQTAAAPESAAARRQGNAGGPAVQTRPNAPAGPAGAARRLPGPPAQAAAAGSHGPAAAAPKRPGTNAGAARRG